MVLAECCAQLSHHHLLTQHAPRCAARLRIPELPLQPLLLIDAEQRAAGVGDDRIVGRELRLTRLERRLQIAAVQARIEHDQIGEIADAEAAIDLVIEARLRERIGMYSLYARIA